MGVSFNLAHFSVRLSVMPFIGGSLTPKHFLLGSRHSMYGCIGPCALFRCEGVPNMGRNMTGPLPVKAIEKSDGSVAVAGEFIVHIFLLVEGFYFRQGLIPADKYTVA